MYETILDLLDKYDTADDDLAHYCRTNCPEGVDFRYGATRGCFILPDSDFVVKFDLYCNGHYCAMENYNYHKAKEYRIEQILLPIRKDTILSNGIAIYVQTKYTYGYRNRSRQITEEMRNAYRHMNNKTLNKIYNVIECNTTREWLSRVIQLYGKKFVRSFEHWQKECDVNDLHTGNIGFLKNRPILLDYAGFQGVDYTPPKNIIENF